MGSPKVSLPTLMTLITRQHPDIEDIGVYGIPDEKVQELVSAVVVKNEASALTELAVLDFINKRLDNFKHLRGGVRFVKSIPRNPQGKVIRTQLMNLY